MSVFYDFSTPLPPLPPAEQYCNTVGYNHFNAQEDDIYSKPSVSLYIICLLVWFEVAWISFNLVS